ncbi:hypothetical protein C8J57DRAFT_1604108 [Mycena rebaudengoi]|nr:hypothetical protein C8J57DRAFT_1604108 [Mycena rebaudengoi]
MDAMRMCAWAWAWTWLYPSPPNPRRHTAPASPRWDAGYQPYQYSNSSPHANSNSPYANTSNSPHATAGTSPHSPTWASRHLQQQQQQQQQRQQHQESPARAQSPQRQQEQRHLRMRSRTEPVLPSVGLPPPSPRYATLPIGEYGYEGEGDRGITMRGGGHGRKSSAYMALAALARRAGDVPVHHAGSGSAYSNNTSTAYPYRPATPGSTPPLSADLVEDDSGASASEGEYQEFRGPSGGMGRRRGGKLLTPPATPPRDGEGVVGVVHEGYTDEHEQHQADDEHADDEQHPPRPLFNARKASAQCRRLEGYVSFAAVEGLGEPPSPAPSSASTSTSDEEEDGKGGRRRKRGSIGAGLWGGGGCGADWTGWRQRVGHGPFYYNTTAAGRLDNWWCGAPLENDGGRGDGSRSPSRRGPTPVETRRQDRRRRTMCRRTPPRDGVERWRHSWTAEQAPRVDCRARPADELWD